MNSLAFFLCLSLAIIPAFTYEYRYLRCLVCKVTVKELQKEVDKVSDKKIVDVGSYRIDGEGKVKTKRKPLIESEQFLTEVMEEICEKMSNYVKATKKTDGELLLLNLSEPSGTAMMGEVDFIQDGDLNRSLPHICKGLLEEFDSDFVEVYGRRSKNAVDEICYDAAALCDKDNEANEFVNDRFEL